MPIRDGETLTVAYSDAAPVATVTATGTIDLAPPTIAIVQPADNSFAGSQSTLSLTVADSGAGLTLAAIRDGIRTLPAVSGEIVETTTPTSAASYTLTQTPTAAAPIPEGLTLMWAGAPGTSVIRDAVGNQPVGSGVALVADPTARALNTRGTRANPFHFTVDPAAPTLASARTGGKLDTNPTPATLGQIIADSTARNAITVTLDLGIGGAPVDPDTIQTGDFTVTGDSVAFTVIAVIIGTQVGTTQNLLLVLSSDLPTGALPIVKLVGELKDKAGNSQSNVTIPQNQVVDDLAPVITVTMTGDASSRPISNKEVVIGVTSSEPVTIAGTARYLVISGDNPLQDDPTTATAALAFTSTGTNTWEATVLINSILPILTFRNSGLVNVQVIVADDAGNVGIAGLADPDGTIQRAVAVISAGALVFEFDNRLNDGVFDPGKIFALSPGPLITINFDAEGNEYAVTSGDTVIKVDSHPDVDLTKAILTMPDGSTGDVLAQFGNADANSFVMDGTALDTGDYILTVQAKDILGNNRADSVPVVPGGTTNPESFVWQFTITTGDILGTIKGQVLLQGQNSSLGAFIQVADAVHFVTADGTYDIKLLLGTYDVSIAVPGYLPVTITGVQVVPTVVVVLPTITLTYGDANGDGVIGIEDLAIMARNLGKTSTTMPVP